jgi:hypothetical protein
MLNQKLHSAGSQPDFIARLCTKKMSEHVEQLKVSQHQTDSKGLLLYQRDVEFLAGFTGAVSAFDQVPFGMIQQSPEKLMAMLPAEQYSVLLSNLAFDWVDAGLFIRLLDYLLEPEGEFWFSCYGSLTAGSTRSILSKIDNYAHFNAFYDLQDIGDALLGAGFKDVVLESSVINLEYDSVTALLADTERVYGVNIHPERRSGLTPVSVLNEFKARVEEIIKAEGKFTEQVEILVAHGRKSTVSGLNGVIPVRQG